jgi:short-subunit dehydrogenase
MNILITGASKGIGYEIVKQFAANSDNNIVALSRDIKLLQKLKSVCKNDYDNDIHIYSIDFLSSSYKQELINIVSIHNSNFDIIINNAGYLVNKPFTETTSLDIYNTYQINVFAPISILQIIIPGLDENKLCHIINIGSMGGYQGSTKFPGLSIYSTSKSALANLTECLAEEYKDKNIKINCLALGSVQTDMLNNAFPGFEAQTSPSEMASFIVEFCQKGGEYFNGKIIPISKSTP